MSIITLKCRLFFNLLRWGMHFKQKGYDFYRGNRILDHNFGEELFFFFNLSFEIFYNSIFADFTKIGFPF
jgi:hypothetical protein